MSARFTAPDARAILVDRALSYLERLFTARDARERIIAANSLVALAAALGANLDSKPNGTLVYYNSRLLRRLGVRIHDFNTLQEVLAYEFSNDQEVDSFVKALYVASTVLFYAATLPSGSKDFLQI
jgi:hypothetical protein